MKLLLVYSLANGRIAGNVAAFYYRRAKMRAKAFADADARAAAARFDLEGRFDLESPKARPWHRCSLRSLVMSVGAFLTGSSSASAATAAAASGAKGESRVCSATQMTHIDVSNASAWKQACLNPAWMSMICVCACSQAAAAG